MMNNHLEKLCDELRAELGALQKKMQMLEAKQAESKVRAIAVAGRRLGKNILITLLPLAALLAAGGLLYGQGAVDALFIDKEGNATFSGKVGIGKSGPREKLEVSGGKIQLDGNQQVKFTDTGTSNNLKLQLWSGYGLGINGGTLFYAANGRHSWRDNNGSNERMALTTGADGGLTVAGTGNSSFAGNVGIGATSPEAKLDVAGSVRLGKGVAESWFPYTDNNAYISGNQTIFRSGKSGDHKEFVRINQNGNVGIGTTDPRLTLDVDGWIGSSGSNQSEGGWRLGRGPQNDKGNRWVYLSHTNAATYQNLAVGDLYVRGKITYQDKNLVFNNRFIPTSVNVEAESDWRLKTRLDQITNALERLKKLRGFRYHWNETGLRYFTRDIERTLSAGPNATSAENRKLWQQERDKRYKELSRTNVGVVAQDVESVLPEAVSTDEKGYKSVRYHYLIPLLIEAVKEQDKAFQELARTVAWQHAEIERLTVAQQTVQHQLAEMEAVKAQAARRVAAVQRVTATQALSSPDAVARLSETKTK